MQKEHKLKNDIDGWLLEDSPFGDITADTFVPSSCTATGRIYAKGAGTVAGVEVAAQIFEHLGIDVQLLKKSGDKVSVGDDVLRTKGDGRNTLRAER